MTRSISPLATGGLKLWIGCRIQAYMIFPALLLLLYPIAPLRRDDLSHEHKTRRIRFAAISIHEGER